MRRAFTAASMVLICASLAWPQHSSEVDAAALIERTRQRARDYTNSLPDFECTELVRRYADAYLRRRGLTPSDRLTIRIRYARHKEEHKLLSINDEPADRPFESLSGSIGTGEFGSTLSAIFDPATATVFRWESWKTVRKHRVAVYRYAVDAAHSRYHLVAGIGSEAHAAIVSYHGVLEIDSETNEVLHFSYVADHLPKELRLTSASTTVDYDFADVGGQPYLLPARSVTEIEAFTANTKNEIAFRDYHKFTAASSIDFGPVK